MNTQMKSPAEIIQLVLDQDLYDPIDRYRRGTQPYMCHCVQVLHTDLGLITYEEFIQTRQAINDTIGNHVVVHTYIWDTKYNQSQKPTPEDFTEFWQQFMEKYS